MAIEGPRNIRPEELPALIETINTIFRRDNNLLPSMADEFPLHLRPENAPNLWVMLDGSKPVTHYGATRNIWLTGSCRIPVASVGGVGTLNEYRGQGFATAVMAACEEYLRTQGVLLEYISGTRGLYLRNGAFPGGEMHSYVIETGGGSDAPAPNYSHRAAVDYDFEWIQTVYRREPVRYARTPEHWQKFLALDTISPTRHKQDTLLVEDLTGANSAYLVVHTSLPAHDKPEARNRATVVEYAGLRSAVLETVLKLARTVRQVVVQVPHWDEELITLLTRAGWSGTPAPVRGHTIKILNPGGLVAALAPLFYEAAGVPEGSISADINDRGEAVFSGLGEQIVLQNREELSKILFGLPGSDPLELPVTGKLGAALRAALPVPVPLAGLNYT